MLAALLLAATHPAQPDTEFASFWRAYARLLPPPENITNGFLFNDSELEWLQVCTGHQYTPGRRSIGI